MVKWINAWQCIKWYRIFRSILLWGKCWLSIMYTYEENEWPFTLQKSVVDAVMDATKERPWLWAVLILVVVLPLVLIIAYCCMSGSESKVGPHNSRCSQANPVLFCLCCVWYIADWVIGAVVECSSGTQVVVWGVCICDLTSNCHSFCLVLP